MLQKRLKLNFSHGSSPQLCKGEGGVRKVHHIQSMDYSH